MKFMDYECKCGSDELYLKGNGLYCEKCGKWVKWLKKDDVELFKHLRGEQPPKERLLKIIAELEDIVNGCE